MPQFPLVACTSEWHCPQYKILMCTSLGPGSGLAISMGVSSESADVLARALIPVALGMVAMFSTFDFFFGDGATTRNETVEGS